MKITCEQMIRIIEINSIDLLRHHDSNSSGYYQSVGYGHESETFSYHHINCPLNQCIENVFGELWGIT